MEARSSAPKARRLAPLFALALGLSAYAGYAHYKSRQPYEWSGTVEARTIEVGSRTGGRVKEVLVREGDRVAAGAPLVVLEAFDLEAQRLMAEAALHQAEAGLAKLEHGARPEEIEQASARAQAATAAFEMSRTGARREDVEAARARLEAAQVAVDKATTDEARVTSLAQSGALARAELDTADAALRGAVAQRDAAKSALAALENGSRREELAQARARADEAAAQSKLVSGSARVEDLAAARATVEAARGRLAQVDVAVGELTIRAPRAVRVEALDLRPGDLVTPNAPAATLVEDDALYVRIYVPETQLAFVHIGAKLPVYVDSFPDRGFHGTVTHLSSVGEYSPRNLQTADERAFQVFSARVDLDDGKDALRAGMAALAKVAK